MIGAAALLLLYLVLIGRGLRVGDRAPGHVRQAPRHGPHDDHRAADVRDRGRRDAADPAHRRAAAARVVRRVEPRRDLRDARAAGPASRRRTRWERVAWIGRSAGSGSRSWCCSPCCSPRSRTSRCSPPTGSRATPRTRAARSSRSTRSSAARSSRPTSGGARRERQERGAPNSDYRFIRTYPDGPLYAATHRLLLADLRAHRARARDEPVPVRRRARARGLELHRPDPRPAEEGRDRRHDDRAPTCSEAAARGAREPTRARSSRSSPGPATSSRSYANPAYDPNPLSTGTDDEINAAWNALNADPEQAAALACEGRALPAGVDLQAGHGLRRARERVRTRDDVAEPARARPAADDRARCENFGDELCNGGSPTVTMAEAFEESCNVHVRRDRPRPRRRRSSPSRRARYGFCPTDPPEQIDVHRADDPVHRCRGQIGRFPEPAVLRRQRAAARVLGDRARQRRSRTRCTWRSIARRSRTAARCASRGW